MKKKLLHSTAICRMTLILSTVMLMTSCLGPDKDEDRAPDDWDYTNPHYPNSAHVFYKAVTDREGHIYDAVQIGNQVWMTENLRVGEYEQDCSLMKHKSPLYADPTEPCYWEVNFNPNGWEEPHPGYLYNYAAVTYGEGNQGPCPNGWHVPSKADWDELKNYMFSQPMYGYQDCNECIAKALCWASDVWNDENSGGTPGNNWATNNASGFSAVPTYESGRLGAYFWSTTKTNDTMAFIYTLSSWETIFDFESAKTNRDMHSIRCIRD